MMTYEPSEAVDFRQRLLTSPDERGDVTDRRNCIIYLVSSWEGCFGGTQGQRNECYSGNHEATIG